VTMTKRAPRRTTPSRDTQHMLVPIVREKLCALGDFTHHGRVH
jgi:hypothetical protein